MKSIKSITESLLTEKYVNLLPSDVDKKRQHVDAVWDMLTKSYAGIGGLKGSGFKNKEDMIKNIPFWKVVVRDKKPVAVAMYKDKDGRKRVAVATNGTSEGKAGIFDIYKNDFERAMFEVSDASLGAILKNVGEDFASKYAKSIDEVRKIMKKDEILEPDFSDPSIQKIIKKYPKMKDYYYRREIGGALKHKILMGTKGLIIKE